MRIIAEFPHPILKISVFDMNRKYILKFEKGNLEQTYKISELDYSIQGLEDIKKVMSPEFFEVILKQFESMESLLSNALKDY
jgi:hypothetical protein